MRVYAGHRYKRKDEEVVYLEHTIFNKPLPDYMEEYPYYANGFHYRTNGTGNWTAIGEFDLIEDLGLVVKVGRTYIDSKNNLITIVKESNNCFIGEDIFGSHINYTPCGEFLGSDHANNLIELATPENQSDKYRENLVLDTFKRIKEELACLEHIYNLSFKP